MKLDLKLVLAFILTIWKIIFIKLIDIKSYNFISILLKVLRFSLKKQILIDFLNILSISNFNKIN